MHPERKDRERIMACPAVRLSVEVKRPWRWLELDGRRMMATGRPRCSDDEDCEFVNGPSCLLSMLRKWPSAIPEQ